MGSEGSDYQLHPYNFLLRHPWIFSLEVHHFFESSLARISPLLHLRFWRFTEDFDWKDSYPRDWKTSSLYDSSPSWLDPFSTFLREAHWEVSGDHKTHCHWHFYSYWLDMFPVRVVLDLRVATKARETNSLSRQGSICLSKGSGHPIMHALGDDWPVPCYLRIWRNGGYRRLSHQKLGVRPMMLEVFLMFHLSMLSQGWDYCHRMSLRITQRLCSLAWPLFGEFLKLLAKILGCSVDQVSFVFRLTNSSWFTFIINSL